MRCKKKTCEYMVKGRCGIADSCTIRSCQIKRDKEVPEKIKRPRKCRG